MANCEEIKDKESQAYKDCLAKEASDTAKAAGVEDLGAKPEALEMVTVIPFAVTVTGKITSKQFA